MVLKLFFGISIFQPEPISTSRPPGGPGLNIKGNNSANASKKWERDFIHIYIYNLIADSLRLFKSSKTSKALCTNKDGTLSSIGTPGWCF